MGRQTEVWKYGTADVRYKNERNYRGGGTVGVSEKIGRRCKEGQGGWVSERGMK